MKKLLSILLGITLAAYGSVALADDVTIYVSKAGDSTAKICTGGPLGYPASKEVAKVPISFDSGADWDSAKRSYTVSASTEAGLEAKKISISIGTDGTATFHAKK